MPLSSVFHTNSLKQQIAYLGDQFAIEGDFLDFEVLNSGHINTTFRATYRTADHEVRRYIFQRLNDVVFSRPRDVMHNVEKVTGHILWKMRRVIRPQAFQALRLFPAHGGRNYIEFPGAGFWRCYNCIENTYSCDVAETPRQAFEAAHAFGTFQSLLCDMNPQDIHETIPFFHHTRKRYNNLMEAARRDSLGRLDFCRQEFDFIQKHEHCVDAIQTLLDQGKLPVRIVHNDTKINNVMLDCDTDQAVCVIDLDTVMPGSSLYDFGDMVRTMTSPADEDEEDLDKTVLRMPMFEAVASGYLQAAADFLTPQEIDLLAFSGQLITLETGIRFLTDYLEGDVYFRISRPNHNLIRSRTQLKLVKEMDQQMDQMCNCVNNVIDKIQSSSQDNTTSNAM